MDNFQLYKTDLNQLLILKLILEQKNLTHTAYSLGVSQPAISRTLTKLKQHFSDDLLIRNRQSYSLTPFATQLQPKLKKLLELSQELQVKTELNLATCQGTFDIALLSIFSSELGIRIIEKVRKYAPNITLKIHEWDKYSLEDLKSLKIDLAVGHANQHYSMLKQRHLLETFPSFAVFNQHPLATKEQVTLNELFDFPHIKFIVPGFERSLENEIDFHLSPRNVILETSNLNLAIDTFLKAKDLVINKAKYFPALIEYKEQLKFITIKNLEQPPAMDLHLLWHSNNQSDLAHQWLRNLIFEESQALLDAYSMTTQ
ncbi:LysR family transcriptional regulator [Vibrio sp. SS-MA-C1-2]|uniref:LysR family transcriptional regulator n=1 Tax=Vibrio sp. SS-MA-C1-2 TaxID=2908646 RepID=UPI001F38D45C|nr:LysR family transcriptional regulator [Vibrio sp. SS-MA-C1-2]UJF17276.1 LysR family transcriptional regulator [Vibrio sp. SS-MA-C1-2]